MTSRKDFERRLRRVEDASRKQLILWRVEAHPQERDADALARVFGAEGPPETLPVQVVERDLTADEWPSYVQDEGGVNLDADHARERSARLWVLNWRGPTRKIPLGTTWPAILSGEANP